MSYFLRISLCLCLWCLASLSRAAPLYIDSDFSSAPLGQSLSYYCDNTNQLSLAQVKQQPFNSLQKEEVSFGFNQPSCWFKFTLQNQTYTPINLVLSSDFNIFVKYNYLLNLAMAILLKA